MEQSYPWNGPYFNFTDAAPRIMASIIISVARWAIIPVNIFHWFLGIRIPNSIDIIILEV